LYSDQTRVGTDRDLGLLASSSEKLNNKSPGTLSETGFRGFMLSDYEVFEGVKWTLRLMPGNLL